MDTRFLTVHSSLQAEGGVFAGTFCWMRADGLVENRSETSCRLVFQPVFTLVPYFLESSKIQEFQNPKR